MAVSGVMRRVLALLLCLALVGGALAVRDPVHDAMSPEQPQQEAADELALETADSEGALAEPAADELDDDEAVEAADASLDDEQEMRFKQSVEGHGHGHGGGGGGHTSSNDSGKHTSSKHTSGKNTNSKHTSGKNTNSKHTSKHNGKHHSKNHGKHQQGKHTSKHHGKGHNHGHHHGHHNHHHHHHHHHGHHGKHNQTQVGQGAPDQQKQKKTGQQQGTQTVQQQKQQQQQQQQQQVGGGGTRQTVVVIGTTPTQQGTTTLVGGTQTRQQTGGTAQTTQQQTGTAQTTQQTAGTQTQTQTQQRTGGQQTTQTGTQTTQQQGTTTTATATMTTLTVNAQPVKAEAVRVPVPVTATSVNLGSQAVAQQVGATPTGAKVQAVPTTLQQAPAGSSQTRAQVLPVPVPTGSKIPQQTTTTTTTAGGSQTRQQVTGTTPTGTKGQQVPAQTTGAAGGSQTRQQVLPVPVPTGPKGQQVPGQRPAPVQTIGGGAGGATQQQLPKGQILPGQQVPSRTGVQLPGQTTVQLPGQTVTIPQETLCPGCVKAPCACQAQAEQLKGSVKQLAEALKDLSVQTLKIVRNETAPPVTTAPPCPCSHPACQCDDLTGMQKDLKMLSDTFKELEDVAMGRGLNFSEQANDTVVQVPSVPTVDPQVEIKQDRKDIQQALNQLYNAPKLLTNTTAMAALKKETKVLSHMTRSLNRTITHAEESLIRKAKLAARQAAEKKRKAEEAKRQAAADAKHQAEVYRLCLELAVISKQPASVCASKKPKGPLPFDLSHLIAAAGNQGGVGKLVPWNYVQNGADWTQGLCKNGTQQSPINIDPTKALHDAVTEDLDMAQPSPLRMRFVNFPLHRKYIVNDGTKLVINAAMDESFSTAINPKDFTKWRARTIFFHSPSEHTIAGRHYDVEMQVVHDLLEGKSEQNATSMIHAYFFDRALDANTFLSKLGFNAPLPKAHLRQHIDMVNLNELGYAQNGSWYVYQGSNTQPPCAEGVKWYVMTTVFSMTQAQFDNINALFAGNPAFAKGKGNNRLPQPVNKRVIDSTLPEDKFIPNVNYTYEGCFRNWGTANHTAQPKLYHYMGESTNMSAYACAFVCGVSNFSFAGLKMGNQCFCSHHYAQLGMVAPSQCNIQCAGKDTENCGSETRTALYRLKLAGSLHTPPVLPQFYKDGVPAAFPSMKRFSLTFA